MKEAMLYDKLEGGEVRCRLCRHECKIKSGKRGICSVRENREGMLYTLVYDKVAAQGVDPIEKKPFYHFLPGSLAYSVATMGCNFACTHCQNSSLSRTPADHGEISGYSITPEEMVNTAEQRGCRSISFTYSEPTVFAELALDTARLAKERGIFSNFVTNGFMSPGMISEMTGLIDAANVDVKSFSEKFYKKISHGDLKGVLDSVERMHGAGLWIEITTLLIPGLNDDPKEIQGLAQFIHRLDKGIPWHLSRYHPSYRMHDRPPTPLSSLSDARKIGMDAGLEFVYTGNVPGDEGENTLCPGCGRLLIRRVGYTIKASHLAGDQCPDCGTTMAGRFTD